MSAGFYKIDGTNNLIYAPNTVLNAEFELTKEKHEEYKFPIDGWYWFNSEEEAREFFNLPLKELEEEIKNETLSDFELLQELRRRGLIQ